MNTNKEFLEKLRKLINDLRKKTDEANAADPLREFQIDFETLPTKAGGLQITIRLVYMSGGGIESSYVLNDEVSFVLDNRFIRGIKFSRELDEREMPDLPAENSGFRPLLAQIQSFFGDVIPKNFI